MNSQRKKSQNKYICMSFEDYAFKNVDCGPFIGTLL